MIDNFKIGLSYEQGKGFSSNPGYNAYACLLEMLSDDLCEYMHRNIKTPVSQNIEYNNFEGTAVWNISSYDERISEELNRIFECINDYTIDRYDVVLHKQSMETCHFSDFNDIRKRVKNISDSRMTDIRFCTATALKKNGEFLLFPDIELILGNLWNQWNVVFPNSNFEDEAVLKLLVRGTEIHSYSLSSSFYRMKGNQIRGFYGKITVKNRLSPRLREILYALFSFAELNGTGIKNALGMGKTKIQ